MKVLFITHQNALSSYGGAETQILKTMEYINAKNVNINVKLFDMWHDNINNFDIVHIFNPIMFQTESYLLANYAKSNGVKVVVSTIFYYSNHKMGTENSVAKFFNNIALYLRKPLSTSNYSKYLDYYRYFSNTLKMSDMLLPNTIEEKNLLSKFFDVSKNNISIVPNGVDLEYEQGQPELFSKKYGYNNFILFIGRIEQRKNVLNLIKAFVDSNLDTKLIIIGKSLDPDYLKSCKSVSNQNVVFLPPIPHGSDLLKSAYKSAKVFTLPSYYETPGLAALEAGLSGTNLVVTKKGGTREYFDNFAWYVDPSNVTSIKQSLIDAYNTPNTSNLSNHIRNNYTWDIVADKTIKAYNTILNR